MRPPLHPSESPALLYAEERQAKCFASGHKQCSPASRSGAVPDRDIYQNMKQFDADIRRNKWKNKDHFHLVKVKDVYTTLAAKMEQGGAAGPRDPTGAMTATVYSQDSAAKEEVKTTKQRYAQILVE